MKAKKLKRLVDAEIALRDALKPITVRTLTIDFEKRTITIDGRELALNPDMPRLAIPLLGSERLVFGRGTIAI